MESVPAYILFHVRLNLILSWPIKSQTIYACHCQACTLFKNHTSFQGESAWKSCAGFDQCEMK